MAETVSVTQEDREAAAKLYEMFPALSSTPDAGLKTAEFIRSGGADGWSSVQLFARHRLASTQPAPASPREEVAKAIATLVTDEMTNARNAMRGVDAVESSYRKGRYDAAQSIGLLFPDTLAALLQGKQP